MKVFVGTAEIAGMMTFIANALRDCGHEVTTCVDNYGHAFYNYRYDIVLNKGVSLPASKNKLLAGAARKIKAISEKAIRRKEYYRQRDAHDLYIFIWNGFFPDKIDDYKYLKEKGKKIISLFLGSDVRHVSAFAQEYQLDISTWEQWFHSTDLNDQLFRLRKAELFSDLIFSVRDQAGLAIRPYHKLYIPFDTRSFAMNIPGREIPKIVHIPSRSGIKGTSFILETLEELKKEGIAFEFECITGVPNAVVLEKLKDADILIDEIYLHGPGTLSLEGMASGCAVATKTIKNEVYDTMLCNVDFSNLKEGVRQLIVDKEYRKDLALKGKAGVDWINDPKRLVTDMVDKLFKDDPYKEDKDFYFPVFFSERYLLPVNTEISPENKKLTAEVIKKFNLDSGLNTNRMIKEHIL